MPTGAPGEQPEIDKIVKAAQERKDEEIDENDFAVAVDRSDILAKRAKETLKSREEWEMLRTIIQREQTEHTDVALDGKAKLDTLRKEIDDAISPSVSDIKELEKTQPGILNTIKNLTKGAWVTTLGSVLRFLSSIMKLIPNFTIGGINLEQMNVFEKLYNQWFGSAEARDIAAKALKDAGIVLREGTLDRAAYGRLHTKYENALREKLGMKPDGTTDISEVEKTQIRDDFTFQKFIEQEATAYAEKFPGAAARGKERGTTLMGIYQQTAPVDVDAGPEPIALKPGETLTIDARTPDLDGRDLFSAFVDAKTAEVTLDDDLVLRVLDPTKGPALSARLELNGTPYALSADMTGTPFEKKAAPAAAPGSFDLTALASSLTSSVTTTMSGLVSPEQKLAAAKLAGLTVVKRGESVEITVPFVGNINANINEVKTLAAAVKAAPGEAAVTRNLTFAVDGKPYTVPVTLTKI